MIAAWERRFSPGFGLVSIRIIRLMRRNLCWRRWSGHREEVEEMVSLYRGRRRIHSR